MRSNINFFTIYVYLLLNVYSFKTKKFTNIVKFSKLDPTFAQSLKIPENAHQFQGNIKNNISSWERETRRAINELKFDKAVSLIRTLESTVLSNKRNAVYVITETCRRSGNIENVLPLLEEIPKSSLHLFEEDVMPLLIELVNSNRIQLAQLLVSWMEANNAFITAKLYTVLIKGFYIKFKHTIHDS